MTKAELDQLQMLRQQIPPTSARDLLRRNILYLIELIQKTPGDQEFIAITKDSAQALANELTMSLRLYDQQATKGASAA